MNLRNFQIVFQTFLYCSVCNCFLNIEELSELKYGLDISQDPINEAEINLSEGLKIPSKHGQFYFCKLPDKARVMAKQADPQESRLPEDFPIEVLLQPLKTKECLKKVKGWWTYELCIGDSVKQYHTDDGVTVASSVNLGVFASDYDWSNKSTNKEKFKRRNMQKYHSQTYVNGTKCDIHSYNRDTEVRYFCDESAFEPYIDRVEEPSTCSYILTVKTNLLCSHPHTRYASPTKSISIQCQPLLTADKYSRYVVQHQKLVERKNEIIKQKREQVKSLLNHIKSQYFQGSDQLLKDQFPSKSNENEKSQKMEKSEKEFSIEIETAIDMVERFVEEKRLAALSPESHQKLVSFVLQTINRLKHLPSADMARIIEFEVSAFMDLEESKPGDFFMSALQSLGVSALSDFQKRENDQVKVHLKRINAELGEVREENEQDPMIKQLEEEIGQELSSAGFSSTEKIEVHLISNKNPEEVRLTSAQAQQFKDMLVEIVGGVSLEQNEKKRYDRLHKNYNLIFRNDLDDFKPAFAKSDNQQDKA